MKFKTVLAKEPKHILCQLFHCVGCCMCVIY